MPQTWSEKTHKTLPAKKNCNGSAEECRASLYVGTKLGGNGRNDSRRRGGVPRYMQALSWKNAPPTRMSDTEVRTEVCGFDSRLQRKQRLAQAFSAERH